MSPPEPRPAAAGPRLVFVYYRIQPSRVAALLAAFAACGSGRASQREGSPVSAWQPRLMRKLGPAREDGTVAPEEDGQREAVLQTWMEVYRLPDSAPSANDAVHAAIDGWARAAGILELIDGERHYEIFETCA